jgi:hypothetical protein
MGWTGQGDSRADRVSSCRLVLETPVLDRTMAYRAENRDELAMAVQVVSRL